jgi:hypothetical protein
MFTGSAAFTVSISLSPCSRKVSARTERNMHVSRTPNEALYRCKTTVWHYMVQGKFVLAIGVLVQHYKDSIVSCCRCHLLDQEVAREVARRPFSRSLRAFQASVGIPSIKMWLDGITFKKCLEVERNRKRREAIDARVHCDPPSQLDIGFAPYAARGRACSGSSGFSARAGVNRDMGKMPASCRASRQAHTTSS